MKQPMFQNFRIIYNETKGEKKKCWKSPISWYNSQKEKHWMNCVACDILVVGESEVCVYKFNTYKLYPHIYIYNMYILQAPYRHNNKNNTEWKREREIILMMKAARGKCVLGCARTISRHTFACIIAPRPGFDHKVPPQRALHSTHSRHYYPNPSTYTHTHTLIYSPNPK